MIVNKVQIKTLQQSHRQPRNPSDGQTKRREACESDEPKKWYKIIIGGNIGGNYLGWRVLMGNKWYKRGIGYPYPIKY